MATTKQQLETEREKLKKLEFMLEQAKQNAKRSGKTSTPAVKKAQDAVDASRTRVSEIEKIVAKVPETKLTPKQLKTVATQELQKELPAGMYDEKIINDLLAVGLTPEAFKVNGAGAGVLVYMGEKKGKVTTPVGGFVTPTKVADVALTNNVIQSFWTDPAVQKKVTNALIAAGKSDATQLDAFATWQTVVSQSAQLYAAGKGPKFTPFDVLDMVMTKAKGKPDVTTYLDVPRQAELKEKLKGRIFEYIQKEPDDKDPIFQNILNDIKGIYEKGITTTTTVDPKTGRKIVQQKGGVTDALIASKIKKAYDENNVDFLENKSLEAADYFSQWMRS
jgi:hypothetical protein